jgi:hypothetical protein
MLIFHIRVDHIRSPEPDALESVDRLRTVTADRDMKIGVARSALSASVSRAKRWPSHLRSRLARGKCLARHGEEGWMGYA